MSAWTYYNTTSCPVCGKKKDCRRNNANGREHCRGTEPSTPPPGYRHRGQDSKGFEMFSREGDYGSGMYEESGGKNTPFPPSSKAGKSEGFDWAMKNRRPCSGVEAALLANELGVPADVIEGRWAYLANDSRHGSTECWVIPEYLITADGSERMAAMHYRYLAGSRPAGLPNKMSPGNHDVSPNRGYTRLVHPEHRPGPVYLPEGPSDCCALEAMGLACLGRPNNSGGAAEVAGYLRVHPELAGRDLVVIGENDEHVSAAGVLINPGRDGAVSFARELSSLAGRPVLVAFPPEGTKDTRAWFVSRWQEGDDPKALADEFAASLVPLGTFHDERPAPAVLTEEAQAHQAQQLQIVLCPPETEEERERLRRNRAHALAVLRAREDEYRCPCYRHVLLRSADGDGVVIRDRCARWTCPGCLRYLVERELHSAAFHWGTAGQLFECGFSAAERLAVQRQVQRAGGEYWMCRDGEGWWCVSTVRVGRRRDGTSAVPVTASMALSVARTLLGGFDGERRPVRTSHGWKLLRPERSSLKVVGVAAPNTDPALIHEAAEAVGARVQAVKPRDEHLQAAWKVTHPEWTDAIWGRFSMSLFAGEVLPDCSGFDPFPPKQAPSWRDTPAAPKPPTLAEDLGLS